MWVIHPFLLLSIKSLHFYSVFASLCWPNFFLQLQGMILTKIRIYIKEYKLKINIQLMQHHIGFKIYVRINLTLKVPIATAADNIKYLFFFLFLMMLH